MLIIRTIFFYKLCSFINITDKSISYVKLQCVEFVQKKSNRMTNGGTLLSFRMKPGPFCIFV